MYVSEIPSAHRGPCSEPELGWRKQEKEFQASFLQLGSEEELETLETDKKSSSNIWWFTSTKVFRAFVIIYNRMRAGTYAVCRWDSCWPGSAEYRHRSYTDTNVYRAKSECPADLTDTPHTRCCCHCSHHQTAENIMRYYNHYTNLWYHLSLFYINNYI